VAVSEVEAEAAKMEAEVAKMEGQIICVNSGRIVRAEGNR
jgi:hypothetical protein